MKEKIIEIMREVADASGLSLIENINDNTVLLESGLDSLGFAILVARLEEELGYDPFVMMDEPIYPSTLNELVSIYQKFAP
jgi:hypothetical protein